MRRLARRRRFPSISGAIEQKESGGRPGAIGPQTPYGRAYGSMQVQDPTGREMAGKLGIPWQPDLMRGTTPEAHAYQRQIGDAYFNEGREKTGSVRGGLMYYHGGPNRRLWGPKTRSYADDILKRLR